MAVVSLLHDTAVRAAHTGAAAAPRLGGGIGCTDYGSDGRHHHHGDHKLLHEHPLSLTPGVQVVLVVFFRRHHQPRRPPLAKIRPGRPAPAIGPGTTAASATNKTPGGLLQLVHALPANSAPSLAVA